jgi:hypothetical protein
LNKHADARESDGIVEGNGRGMVSAGDLGGTEGMSDVGIKTLASSSQAAMR